MDETKTAETTDLDLSKLLGFRDLSGLGDDAALIAEELDAAHVKIGEGGDTGTEPSPTPVELYKAL